MAKSLLLFIHGLGGDPSGTWGVFQDLLQKDGELKKHSVGHFTYPTHLYRLPFTRRYPRVQTLADALATQIDLRYSDHRDITLVCHSLGGLIGKQYLIRQIESGARLRVKRMLLYAVPSNGAALASVANLISWRHGQLAQLCRDSDLIRHVSEAWIRCKVHERVNVCYIVGALDNVVDEMSARESWGNDKVFLIADRGHRDIVKPKSIDDLPYVVLKKFLAQKHNVNGIPVNLGGSVIPIAGSKKDLRISCAALVRVEFQGQYLLVRSLHRREQFGPFGGVYKYLAGAARILDQMDFRPQATERDMGRDLRGFIQETHLSTFIEWFTTGIDRETFKDCLKRELIEECREAGIAVPPNLDQISYNHIRTVGEGPLPIPASGYNQYRSLDIYEISQDTQAEIFFASFCDLTAGNSNLLWATSQEIIAGRTRKGILIGPHAAYLFGSRRFWDDGPGIAY